MSSKHRKAKATKTFATLHDFFERGSATRKKSITRVSQEIIVIASDSDDEVEILEHLRRPDKRQKLTRDTSAGDVEFVGDKDRPDTQIASLQRASKTESATSHEPARKPVEARPFGRATLPGQSIRSLADDLPASVERLPFGAPRLLLQPNPIHPESTLESKQPPATANTHMDLDLATNIDDDWGTGDDELAFVAIHDNMGGDSEETLDTLTFDSAFPNSTESLPQPSANVDRGPPSAVSGRVNISIPPHEDKGAPEMAKTEDDSDAFSVLMNSRYENQAWKETASGSRARTLSHNCKDNGNRRKAPFYKVLQGMPIAVDAFCYGSIPGVTAYFLTHAHSDHYTNLSSNWKNGPIYCSDGTANLIIHMLNVDPKWVYPLPMDMPSVVPDTGGVSVTLIEANHCPGSSMFFFEGPQTTNAGDSTFKSPFIGSSKIFRYLHCGDFRASPQHVLHPAIKGKKIDHVYLDTTYLDPKYTFPPQPLVISACAELARRIAAGESINSEKNGCIDTWIKKSIGMQSISQTLFVIGTYSIGKERVAKAIARALKSKIYCDARKSAILLCQADPELHGLLTSDPLDACVHLIPLGAVTSDKLKIYVERFQSKFDKAVGFRPTGWTYTSPAGSDLMPSITSILSGPHRDFTYASLRPARQSTQTLQLFPVPYSEHSSFFELTCFAMSFDWGKMIATVGVGSEHSRERIGKWIAKWQAERRRRGWDSIIPYRHPEYW